MAQHCTSSSALSVSAMLRSFLLLELETIPRVRSLTLSSLRPTSHGTRLLSQRPFINNGSPRRTSCMSRTTHPGVATATSVSMKNRSFHSTSARLSESPAVERDDSAEPKPSPQPERKRENWQVQKEALKVKFQDGWHPKKKLSPDAMEGIRHLHAQDPERFSTPFLANEFKVPAEAIRRILKSKWRPSGEEVEDRRKRWEKRNVRIWNQMAEIGLRPKRKAFEKFSDAEKLDKK